MKGPRVRSLTVAGSDLIILVLQSFKRLLHLENLSISLDLYDEHHQTFLQWSFPRLVSCHMVLTSTKGIGTLLSSFMSRHLTLVSFSSPFREDLDARVPIPLLSLRKFRGPVSALPQIVGRDLGEARLAWAPKGRQQDVEKHMLALESLTSEDIPLVCSHDYCDDYFMEVLDSMTRNIPHTRTLVMRLFNPRALDVRSGFPGPNILRRAHTIVNPGKSRLQPEMPSATRRPRVFLDRKHL